MTAKRPPLTGPEPEAPTAADRKHKATGAKKDATSWRLSPTVGVTFQIPFAKLEAHAENQREWLRTIAADLEAGNELSKADRTIAAVALRNAATMLKPKRPKGKPPTWDAGSESMCFVADRAHGLSATASYKKIADRLMTMRGIEVTEAAVAKQMKVHAPGTARLLEESFGLEGIPENLFAD